MLKFNNLKKDKGCFDVELEENNDGFEVLFTPKVNESLISKDQEELYLLIEDTLNIIDSSNLISNTDKKYYIKKIFDIAETGLSIKTKEVYPVLAMKMLKKLKQEVCLKESNRIKNDYLKELGKYGLGHIVIAIFILIISKDLKLDLFNKYIYTYIGSIIGCWVSFNARKLTLKFEELCIIEKDGLEPMFRIIHNGLCAIIIMLFVNTNVVSISVCDFNTNLINNSQELQILLGVIVGLIDYPMAQKIYNKASTIIDEL